MDTAEAKNWGGAGCDSGWAEGEFEGVELGDARLERRLIRVVEDLSSQPEYPVNQACEDAAAAKVLLGHAGMSEGCGADIAVRRGELAVTRRLGPPATGL